MEINRFYFNPRGEGCEVFLGPTETRLMELAWREGELTVKKALFFLTQENKYAYTTLMTVLTRLADKGYLKRKKNGRYFIYEPVSTRKEFLDQRIKQVSECLNQFK